MSVLSPVIDSIDGAARRIYLKSGVVNYFPIEDIYHEYRYLRRTDESLRKWEPLIRAEGNVPKGGGAFTPRYVVLLNGTKIVPFNESSQLNQLGDIITDNPDIDPTIYDVSGLTVPKPIFIKPSESEIIQLNSKQIEFASYNGGITVDIANLTGNAKNSGNIGGDILGSLQFPCDNLVDAANELSNVGLGQIYVIGNITVNDETSWTRIAFIGDSPNKSLITINPIADVLDCEFYNATLSGTLDGNSYIANSIITNLNFVDGVIEECYLGPGLITLGLTTVANFVRCNSNLPGPDRTPVIDHNGSGIIALRDYTGGGRSRNFSDLNSAPNLTLTVNATARTITRQSGDFVAEGFNVDDYFTLSGLANNTGQYVIESLTATEITVKLDTNNLLTDETGDGDEQVNRNGEHSIDLARGQWVLEDTITAGVWVFRGIGKLIDQNGDSILSNIDSQGRPVPTAWNGAIIINELLNQENISRGLAFTNYPIPTI